MVAAPLSSTPVPIYEWVVDNAGLFSGWERFSFVLMDEQLEQDDSGLVYVRLDDPASYERFAEDVLLGPLGGRVMRRIHAVKPALEYLPEFDIDIDLLVLALGPRGTYAQVMPGTPPTTGWHVAQLIDEFKEFHTNVSSSSYPGARFRQYGMSLGPRQVIAARSVIVIISGGKKRALARELLSRDRFDPEFPLSIIHHEAVRDRVEVFLTTDVEW
ncbi:MAG: 6-phosphogluconolactonase [Mycobacterium sp.]|nr:6-phosphogluconolactonase [Mycobacterium sp.]